PCPADCRVGVLGQSYYATAMVERKGRRTAAAVPRSDGQSRRRAGGAASDARTPDALDLDGARTTRSSRTHRPYCTYCSLNVSGRRKPNRAAYVVVLVNGLIELACQRHADMALAVGGFAWQLALFPPVIWKMRPRPAQAAMIERS